MAITMCFSLSIPAFAAEENIVCTTRFGVSITESAYQALISQGFTAEDIDYLNENEYNQYIVESGGDLITKVENYYICKENGTNLEVSQGIAEAVANNLNLGIMPAEDEAGYDTANDGVCRLVFILYKSGTTFRSTATVTWMTDPPNNSQDILGIAHNEGLITDGDDVTTTMWYDWSNDGYTYTTATGTAASIKTDTGCGAVCKFNRTVTSSSYNTACKNFRYRVEMRSSNNSNTVRNAMVQADYYRGTRQLSTSLNVNWIAVLTAVLTGNGLTSAISLVSEYKASFADVLQADIMYTINP